MSENMFARALARAETDLEQARRRYEIAQALAADWSWWAPLLGVATEPQDEHETVAEPPPVQAEAPAPVLDAPTAPQSVCRQCGGPLPPRRNRGGRPKVFCSPECSHVWHGQAAWQRKKARRAPEVELPPEPLPDLEERPFYTWEGQPEDEWLSQQLALPKLPWQVREQAPGY